MILNFKPTALVALASALVVAGCVSAPMGNVNVPVRTTSPVDGQWMDVQGVALSTFSGGSFQSVATDTGNKLSEGTYRQIDGSNIEIAMTSLIRQTFTRVNCSLASSSQLNCTNAEGQQFSLFRRG